MKPEETRLTRKHQTTVPKEVRAILGVGAGQTVTWHVVKGVVLVDVHRKMKDPVKFLTSQANLSVDAVKLVKETRASFG